MSSPSSTAERFVVSRAGLASLLPVLQTKGFEVWGPVKTDGALCYQPVDSLDDLPRGISDEQAPGRYRMVAREDESLFQYASTAQSWKRVLLPPSDVFLTMEREGSSIRFVEKARKGPPRAFIGVRACDLAAIGVLDRVLMNDRFPDGAYVQRRRHGFVVAVNCGYPSGTCFCHSMGTGPEARGGFDLALTEILSGEHRFVVTVGSDEGAAVLRQVEHRPAEAPDRKAEENVLRSARENMGRKLNLKNLKEQIQSESTSKQWDEIAKECMACGNCTMACPTCFCMTTEDHNLLDGSATRTRVWDSCFSLQYSYIHGGSVRSSAAARYRQWLTHKLASWQDQFGQTGCVGCGRCITWCPVGIDITREAERIRSTASWGGI